MTKKKTNSDKVLRPASLVLISDPSRGPNIADDEGLEAELHAEVIAATRDGRLSISPDGMIVGSLRYPDGRRVPLSDGVEPPATLGGKVACYRAAGLPMKRVDPALQQHAWALSEVLAVVGGGGPDAPAEFVELAQVLVNIWLAGEARIPPWIAHLESVMQVTAPLESGAPLTFGGRISSKRSSGEMKRLAIGAARTVIDRLVAGVGRDNVPPQILEASDADLDTAGRVLLNARVRRVGRTGGPLKSPWSVAQAFANALGVRDVPDKKDATRERKTRRRTPRPTERGKGA